MARIDVRFATLIYRAGLGGPDAPGLRRRIRHAIRALEHDDTAGLAWSRAHGYRGYTSYASLADLPWRDPDFGLLAARLDRHVAAFARTLDLDLGRRRLVLDSLWVNVLRPGAAHGAHIHPQSVISGTYYVDVPARAGGLKLEDPRFPLMMASPARKARARPMNRPFETIHPKAGEVVLWESWLRHEVLAGAARADRISVSFNYALGQR